MPSGRLFRRIRILPLQTSPDVRLASRPRDSIQAGTQELDNLRRHNGAATYSHHHLCMHLHLELQQRAQAAHCFGQAAQRGAKGHYREWGTALRRSGSIGWAGAGADPGDHRLMSWASLALGYRLCGRVHLGVHLGFASHVHWRIARVAHMIECLHEQCEAFEGMSSRIHAFEDSQPIVCFRMRCVAFGC